MAVKSENKMKKNVILFKKYTQKKRVSVQEILEALEEIGPYPAMVADKIGCCYMSVHRRTLVGDPDYSPAVDAAFKHLRQRIFEQTKKRLSDNDAYVGQSCADTDTDGDDKSPPKTLKSVTADIFALKASPEAKAAGWGERQEHTGADGKDLIDIGTFLNAVAAKKDK